MPSQVITPPQAVRPPTSPGPAGGARHTTGRPRPVASILSPTAPVARWSPPYAWPPALWSRAKDSIRSSLVGGDETPEVVELAGLHGEVHGLPEEEGERAGYHAWAASVP